MSDCNILYHNLDFRMTFLSSKVIFLAGCCSMAHAMFQIVKKPNGVEQKLADQQKSNDQEQQTTPQSLEVFLTEHLKTGQLEADHLAQASQLTTDQLDADHLDQTDDQGRTRPPLQPKRDQLAVIVDGNESDGSLDGILLNQQLPELTPKGTNLDSQTPQVSPTNEAAQRQDGDKLTISAAEIIDLTGGDDNQQGSRKKSPNL